MKPKNYSQRREPRAQIQENVMIVEPAGIESWHANFQPLIEGFALIERGANGELKDLARITREFIASRESYLAGLSGWSYGELFGFRSELIPQMARQKFKIMMMNPAMAIVLLPTGHLMNFERPNEDEVAWFMDDALVDRLKRQSFREAAASAGGD